MSFQMSFLSSPSFRHIVRRVVPTAIAFALLATTFTTTAQAAAWIGGGADSEYSTAANWDDGLVPLLTQDIDGEFTVERSVDSIAERTFVRGGATLNIPGGTHSDNRAGAGIYTIVGNGSVGRVNQSGGSFNIGHSLAIGGGTNGESDGAYILTGGDLIPSRGSNSNIFLSALGDNLNPGGRPSVELGRDGSGTGLLELSGGSFATRAGVHNGDGGTFSVVGSGVSSIGIGSNGSLDGSWLQTPGATLKVEIDAGGLTPIFVADTGTGTVYDPASVLDQFGDSYGSTCTTCAGFFASGTTLDVSFGAGVTQDPVTYTVMEVENRDIEDLGLTLVAASDWEYVVDNSGTNGLLKVLFAGGSSGGDLACDLDVDGDCDQADIDVLYASSPDATAISDWLSQASDPTNPYKTTYPGGSLTDTYVLGDVNLDGNVDSTDLGLILNNFGDTAGANWGAGNLNADANVDSTDLGLLLNNFGSTSAAAVSAVPEPSACVLILISAFGVLGLVRRRR